MQFSKIDLFVCRSNRNAKRTLNVNDYPCIFKSLMVALISALSPEMWHWFWFIIFLPREVLVNGFHLSFSITIPLISQLREPQWGFCYLLSTYIQWCALKLEITTKWMWKPTVQGTWAKILLITRIPKLFFWTENRNDSLSLLYSTISSEIVLWTQSQIIFFSPVHRYHGKIL